VDDALEIEPEVWRVGDGAYDGEGECLQGINNGSERYFSASKEGKRSRASVSSALNQTFNTVSMNAHRNRTWRLMDEDAFAASLPSRLVTEKIPHIDQLLELLLTPAHKRDQNQSSKSRRQAAALLQSY
jgi:hypothetical protein